MEESRFENFNDSFNSSFKFFFFGIIQSCVIIFKEFKSPMGLGFTQTLHLLELRSRIMVTHCWCFLKDTSLTRCCSGEVWFQCRVFLVGPFLMWSEKAEKRLIIFFTSEENCTKFLLIIGKLECHFKTSYT